MYKIIYTLEFLSGKVTYTLERVRSFVIEERAISVVYAEESFFYSETFPLLGEVVSILVESY